MKVIVNNKNKKIPQELVELCKNEILARIFYNRGIKTASELEQYLNYEKYKPYNPEEFPDINIACEIVKNAIDNDEKISVYGDYDVDGITATSILVLSLRKLGGNISYHVPDRFSEGYGMNIEVVKSLYEQGVTTIITCDCGISNFDEIKYAKDLGMKVVLTDHHTIGESLPEADVIINPKLLPVGHPARDISGCTMAYFFIKALYLYINKELEDDCIDLVALSIISDVMPLKNENRYLFNLGFNKLKKAVRPGIRALLNCVNSTDLTVEDIGFQLTPRLNAVGRMDTAKKAVELFLTEDEKSANLLAEEIDRFNTDRKNIQNDIYVEAKEIVETKKKNKKILILYGENWHHGILGIVAGKICEEYKKPCIILSQNENGLISGSARSTEQLNIYDALSKFSEYLTKFGGHSQAAGLSLEEKNLDKFIQELENYTDIYLAEEYEEVITVDAILPFSDIDEDLLIALALGEPYGEAFPAPRFVTADVKILREAINKGTHHFMTLIDSSKKEIGTTLWNYGPESLIDKKCTVIYDIYKDTYNGRNEIKLKIQNIVFDPVEIEDAKVSFIDRREYDILDIIKEFKNTTIFYEGPLVFKPDLPIINSKCDVKISTLVLYSLPKSNKILSELIERTCPEQVVLNYTYLPSYDFVKFQKLFMGVIKNAVMNNNGMINIEDFAQIVQVDEEFIITFSKFLASCNYITVNFMEDGKVKYEIINGKKTAGDNYLANITTRYLAEKSEYVKYMLKMPICAKT